MTNDKAGWAPFDLTKSVKFDRHTDQEYLRKSFFELASQYFEVAKYTAFNLNWMSVTLANVAFSCELFLKAILYGFGTDFTKTHGLKDLFEKLPQSEQTYIATHIAVKGGEKEFFQCLNEQNEAFKEYRYMCEAKTIVGNPIFLFAFADILKFVYESLVKENSEVTESEVSE